MSKHGTGRKATIYDIAAAAGTSASTVSLVLNGSWERYRINAETARRVREVAASVGYSANLRARGLRLSRSSLAGMIIPHYRNRFFAGLAETFETKARERQLCPIVVSTQRDPETELSVVRTLIAQQVECLIIAGVNQPDALNALCREAEIGCVNLDLPGSGAPSVVSDNRAGSYELTSRLIDQVRARGLDPGEIVFVGGRADEFATDERVAGFLQALSDAGVPASETVIERCGYEPKAARAALQALLRAGRPPCGIFVNSITALEGFARLLNTGEIANPPSIVCFDWDPFAASLPVPILMMRQNVEELVGRCFDILDGASGSDDEMVVVAPTLVAVPGQAV